MSTRLIKLNGNTTLSAIVSGTDYDSVMNHSWHIGFLGYPTTSPTGIGKLHQFILPRTPDIPEKYVIDHANRNKLDATRENLRFVSSSFNNWNRAVPTSASSKFKGVRQDKTKQKWIVRVHGKHYGIFTDEREAFRVAAKEAVREWPLWACTSDLLVGPDLLSPQEMDNILDELQQENGQIPIAKKLPCGIVKAGKNFRAVFRGKLFGSFATVALAKVARAAKIAEVNEAEWREHLKLPITRDQTGNAIIALTGDKADGRFTRVPAVFWHQLTFKHSWYYQNGYAAGTWDSKTQALHLVIYKLLNPDFQPSWNNSVDHIITEEKLNNDADNLRAATMAEQHRNKTKRAGTTSKYVGVSARPNGTWQGQLMINRQKYSVNAASELECAKRLDALEFSLVGDRARVRVPADQPGVDLAVLEAQQTLRSKRGYTSKYVGVHLKKDGKWRGTIRVNKKQHTVNAHTELECAKKLDALELSLLGAGARVRVPVEQTTT